jgi:two-component system, NarL family, response regulator LiaR
MRLSFEMDSEGEPETIRAVLADGDPQARKLIREALRAGGIAVVAEAADGDEAVALATFYHPDVVLLDVRLPGLDGVAATSQIHARSPSTCIVLLAEGADEEIGLRAIRAGASGYLARSLEADVLPRVIRGAVEGEAAISRRLAMHLIESYRRTPRSGAGMRPVRSSLTDREWEVLDLLTSGARTEEIARTLVLSTETVRSHLKNVYRKLGVRSREEAAEAARRMRDLVV